MAGPTTAERGARQKPESGSLRPPRAARLFRLRMLIILFLVVMAAGGSVWLLYGSSWLRLTRVSVSGTRVMTDAQVREAAGVRLGTPLISLDTDEIEARLRRELPRIDSVEVVRSWPHGIGLNVTERTPVLILASGGKFIEVDKGGVRYATIPQPPKSVPALELTATRSPSLSRFGTARLVREAARVTRDLPTDVARDLRTVKVRSYDAVSLELSGGRTVVWGSSERGRAKAATLAALMKTAPRARHFDVSVPTAPASSDS